MFYHQVVRTSSIPFELKAEIPNETTLQALKEAEDNIIEDGKAKVELWKTLAKKVGTSCQVVEN